MKKWICIFLALLTLSSSVALADGREGSSNYLYTIHGEAISAPPAYTLGRSLTARDFPEIADLSGLVDGYVSDEHVYILCAKQLLVLNHDMTLKQAVVSYLDQEGNEVKLDGEEYIIVKQDCLYECFKAKNVSVNRIFVFYWNFEVFYDFNHLYFPFFHNRILTIYILIYLSSE